MEHWRVFRLKGLRVAGPVRLGFAEVEEDGQVAMMLLVGVETSAQADLVWMLLTLKALFA